MKYSGAEAVSSSKAATAGARILVIDDEIGPRESLRILLKDSYDVVLVESGEKGVETIKEEKIDLVILDLKMKKMGGIETLEKIREINPSVAVVILTGYGTLETAQKAIRLGACDYVNKPFEVSELLETVRRNIEKKREREEKEQAINRLKGLNNDLSSELSSLKKAISSQRLSRSFLHEICNPLTSVLGYVQLLLLRLEKKAHFSSADRERTYKELRIIENELQRCQLMYRSYTSFSKNGIAGSHQFPIRTLIEEVLLLLKPQIEKQRVRVEKFLDQRCAAAAVGASEIRQVLLNLCINSLHAMKHGGVLRLSAVCRPDGTAEIEVADSGSGMDEEVARRAFEPSFTTKKAYAGSGLGLPISKRIVEKLGGRISMETRKGEGTRVTIMLPLSESLAGNAAGV